ncbi:MAG: FAD binding domain-containing protein, partial [Clostridia bacterium]|nr:FAD binding domain-containing protein [Clostridia bacterium]
DFAYAQPDSPQQAVALFQEYIRPLYYGGGSEIITMCRAGAIAPNAIIDLKQIPEMNVLNVQNGYLVVGGCVPLRAIKDAGLFPLFGLICGRIADHTNQCRITLGGNLCGTISYRETVLALLLTDATVVLFGPKGGRIMSVHSIFDARIGRLRLEPGELVLQVCIPIAFLGLPFAHIKKTAGEKIDYPLLSLSAIACPEGIRFAFSGLLPHPFRSVEMEKALNDCSVAMDQRLDNALACLPGLPVTDYQGSGEYRRFVLRQTLGQALEVLEG